jgi:hypothetical protein
MATKIFRGGVECVLPDGCANDFASTSDARAYLLALTTSVVENAPPAFRERVALAMSDRPGAEWTYRT